MTRPPIPSAIKREVRQKCGFGCIICGLPLYEYDHIQEWSEVASHTPDNLILLCNKHHAEKTKGLLPIDKVLASAKEPINVIRGVSAPYGLHFYGDTANVVLGNVQVKGLRHDEDDHLFRVIAIDDTDLISFQFSGQRELELNLIVLDEYNLVAMQIEKNELVYATGLWDVEFVGSKLTLREDARKLLYEIDFCPPNTIEIKRASILCNGIKVVASPSQLDFVSHNSVMNGGGSVGGDIAFALGRCMRRLRSGFIFDYPVSRYPRKGSGK